MNILQKRDLGWATPGNKAFVIVCFALLTLGALTINVLHWSGRDYRQDEAMIVYESVGYSWQTNILNTAKQEVAPPSWWVISDIWIGLFGHLEPTTRFIAVLGTAISLALVYRLSADLFNRELGLVAVFILGTTAFYQFYSAEYRPYFLLCGGTVALHFFFLRWLRHQNFTYAVLYVLTGVFLLYTHYYALYVMAVQVITFVLFVRWNKWVYLRAFGLFFAIALSFLGWLLPFLHTMLVTWPGGIWYAAPSNNYFVFLLYLLTELSPAPFGRFLLALSPILPIWMILAGRVNFRTRKGIMRGNEIWPWLYLWAVVTITLLMAFLVNQSVSNVTARNLIVALPFFAILAATALVALPKRIKWASLPVIAIAGILSLPHFIAFQDFNTESGPYKQFIAVMRPIYEPGSFIVVDTGYIYKHISYWYYQHERFPENVPNAHSFYIMDFGARPDEERNYKALVQLVPDPPINFTGALTDDAIERFHAFARSANEIWYIKDMPTAFSPKFLDVLAENFQVVKDITWDKDHELIQLKRK